MPYVYHFVFYSCPNLNSPQNVPKFGLFRFRSLLQHEWYKPISRCYYYRDETIGDDLSELQSEAVPEEVRKWLASTFAKQESAPRRRGPDERPSFRSVANAIRTGIFIEKIYRRMSSSQLMVVPPEVQHALKVSTVLQI